MARTKNQKILRYSLFTVAGVVVLALLSYTLVIRPLQIRQQKANFDKAESNLDALAKQIENTIGKPDETKKVKSCGYASRVSGKGPRGCSISLFLLYRNKNEASANSILSKVGSLFNTKIYDSLGRPDSNSFNKYPGTGPDQSFAQDFTAPENLNCGVKYSYPVIQLGNSHFTNLSGENFEIALSCGGPAISELFPVTD